MGFVLVWPLGLISLLSFDLEKLCPVLKMFILITRDVNECSCFIEVIKRVGESDKMRGMPSVLSRFCNESLINSITQEHKC